MSTNKQKIDDALIGRARMLEYSALKREFSDANEAITARLLREGASKRGIIIRLMAAERLALHVGGLDDAINIERAARIRQNRTPETT